jgi:hypothetical protein
MSLTSSSTPPTACWSPFTPSKFPTFQEMRTPPSCQVALPVSMPPVQNEQSGEQGRKSLPISPLAFDREEQRRKIEQARKLLEEQLGDVQKQLNEKKALLSEARTEDRRLHKQVRTAQLGAKVDEYSRKLALAQTTLENLKRLNQLRIRYFRTKHGKKGKEPSAQSSQTGPNNPALQKILDKILRVEGVLKKSFDTIEKAKIGPLIKEQEAVVLGIQQMHDEAIGQHRILGTAVYINCEKVKSLSKEVRTLEGQEEEALRQKRALIGALRQQ